MHLYIVQAAVTTVSVSIMIAKSAPFSFNKFIYCSIAHPFRKRIFMAVTVISSPGLFMIFTAGRNLECAVNLFAEHDARKLVREGHRGHGKPEVGLPLDLFGQAPRTADKKATLLPPPTAACSSFCASSGEESSLPSIHMAMV